MVKKLFSIFFIFQWVTIILLTQNVFSESVWKSSLREPSQYREITITQVLSVDTIRLENDEKIKLIGLKAPQPPPREKIERDDKGLVIKRQTTSFKTLEQQAFDYARELMEGKKVRLEFDVRKDGPEGTPAYVFLLEDNSFVNAEILRQGSAYFQISPPNTKYQQQLREAYQEARREKRGLQGE